MKIKFKKPNEYELEFRSEDEAARWLIDNNYSTYSHEDLVDELEYLQNCAESAGFECDFQVHRASLHDLFDCPKGEDPDIWYEYLNDVARMNEYQQECEEIIEQAIERYYEEIINS
jgi:hypothetical protein